MRERDSGTKRQREGQRETVGQRKRLGQRERDRWADDDGGLEKSEGGH